MGVDRSLCAERVSFTSASPFVGVDRSKVRFIYSAVVIPPYMGVDRLQFHGTAAS